MQGVSAGVADDGGGGAGEVWETKRECLSSFEEEIISGRNITGTIINHL